MVIYHSREALTARLAGLLHTGRLAPTADPRWAWESIRAVEAYGAKGLWRAGTDGQGEPVWAVGRASRPEVVSRIIHGLAGIFGIHPDCYLLVGVGPVHAWGDLLLIGLRGVGLGWLAHRLELRLIAQRWAACTEAVELAKERLAQRGRQGGL